MIKKILILFISIFILTSCNISNSKIEERTIYEYYITIDDIDIKVNMLFDYVTTTLGRYETYKYEGNNYIYTYDGLDIKTYLDGNIEKIESIYLTTDKYKTNEGIRLGNTIDEVKYTYGESYLYKNRIYTYTLNDSRITFISDDGIIIGIEYSLVR